MSCCGKSSQVSLPKLIHGAVSIAKNVLQIGLAPSHILNERRGICHNCKHNKAGLLPTCELCHCIIAQKIMRAEAQCPIGSWTVIP